MTTFKTRFIALLTAGALALGAASPAAAASDGQKAVTTVLGLLALGAVIHELDKNKSSGRAAPVRTYDDRWHDDRRDDRRDGHRGDRHGDRRKDHRNDWGNAPVRREVRAPRVPAACVISVNGRGGRSEAVSQDCLTRSRFEGRLPSACAFDIRNERGRSSSVYGTSCLRNKGIQIGR